MKKLLAIIFAALLSFGCFVGCGDGGGNGGGDGGSTTITDRGTLDYIFDGIYTKKELADNGNGFSSASDIVSAKVFTNGEYRTSYKEINTRQDIKFEMYNATGARMANISGGYAFTLPATEVEVDYTLGKYNVHYTFGDSVLTTSLQANNPYTSEKNPWYIYCGEWIIERINDDGFIEKNGLERINGTEAYEFTEAHSYGDLETKPGYDLYRYDILITDETETVERPYYSVAVIREADDPKTFALFVLKSATNNKEIMDTIIDSYTKITPKGVSKNYLDLGEPKANPNWSTETKDYFKQLMAVESVQWGAFSWSMPGEEEKLKPTNGEYKNYLQKSKKSQAAIEEIWGHKYDIYPTYTHISWYDSMHYFPNEMAAELAGGNGKNDKPVLQFTYQYTTNNNNTDELLTPLFDILRGVYDEHFHRLAKDVKAYGKPVLFRLNNEMNTDWTSYCGMMTLLDPDIFIMTWQRLYDIFEEEGVDNAMWIWNPMGTSSPYCNWGEDLCYFPGKDYVQLLGGTCYEFNNYDAKTAAQDVTTFEEHYSKLYEKNKDVFGKWGMVISEFAVGSGGDYTGELGRNRDVQAKWVKDMFVDLNAEPKPDWVKAIKGAIWFNCNDYHGSGKITNRLCFCFPGSKDYDDLSGTWAAFKEGFAAGKAA